MPLTPAGYRPRIMEENLALHLGAFGAVEVRGPKWCGKTWLSLSQANSVVRLDEPRVRAAVELDAALALQGEEPHLVDEWQEVPAVWDATRRAVDDGAGACGRFLLTGSSTPAMDTVAHSGAGRIARLRMEPMALFEQGLSTGAVSLQSLMLGRDVAGAQARLGMEDLVASLCRGGWPAAQGRPAAFQDLIPAQYIEALCDSAARKADLDPVSMRRALYALARNDGGAASMDTLARDMARGEEPTSAGRAAVARYLDYLEQNYLVRNLGGWDAPGEATTLFGYLSGMAVPLINMSTILTAALSISLVPAISESRTLSDEAGIRSKVATAFTVASVITIPCSVGLHVLGGRVAALIYNAPAAGPAIEIMSWAIFLLGLHQVSTGILQGLGKTRIPVINMIIAAIVKVFLNWNLTAMPTLGIKGSSWATVADIGIAALLNLFFIKKYTAFTFEGRQLLKTALCAAVMGGAVMLVLSLVSRGGLALFLSILVAVPVYILMLLLLKTLTEEELLEIPFLGRRMAWLGHKLGLLK